MKRPRRLVVSRWAAVLAGLLAVYYVVTLVQVWHTGRTDQARSVDAIVVLGAAQYDGRPSPQLAARLDHAAALYADGFAPQVVVTGGKQVGDRFTEAEASRQYLVALGVPNDVIEQEDSGRTTFESLRNVARLLEAQGVDRVLIVSDPFHSLRAKLSAAELGLRAYTSPTPTSTVTGAASLSREIKEAAGICLGRIIGFSRLPT